MAKTAEGKSVRRRNPDCPFCGEEVGMVYLVPPGTMKALRTFWWCRKCEKGWKITKGAKPR